MVRALVADDDGGRHRPNQATGTARASGLRTRPYPCKPAAPERDATDPPHRPAHYRCAMGDEKVRVVLADDHAVVRKGLRLLLEAEADAEVVAEAGDVADARALRPRAPARRAGARPQHARRAHVARGDPATSREARPDTRVVVLTMQDDPAFAREALQAGARGYVLKEAADEELRRGGPPRRRRRDVPQPAARRARSPPRRPSPPGRRTT